MTLDELFLFTLDDLDQRVQLGRGEYDALMSAWLLRKLVFEERPLITAANRPVSRRLRIRYEIVDLPPDPGVPDWFPNGFFYPGNYQGASTLSLGRDAFIARPLLTIEGETVSVRELVKFMAHVQGAVHVGTPKDSKEAALVDYMWRMTIRGPEGEYPGGIHDLVAIGRIVLDAVTPLRQLVERETWPHGRPAP